MGREILDLKEKDGFWLYRQMVHPDYPTIIFLNSETTTFTNITTASVQARWLVELLAGTFKLPSKQANPGDAQASFGKEGLVVIAFLVTSGILFRTLFSGLMIGVNFQW